MSRLPFDIYYGKENDAVALRQMAAECRQRSADSFERCDTDGFLSQWASDITAQQYDRQAHIAEAGGLGKFSGLYEGDRRVAAKLITQPAYNAPWRTVQTWVLRDDEMSKFGRRYIPSGGNSRVQRGLGLSQRTELAPAVACLGGGGKGLSGCASAYVTTRRTGDEWGRDAVLEPVEA